MQDRQGNPQMHGLYEQEKFREMPTKELRDCIQNDKDSSRSQRAQKVLSERGEGNTGGGSTRFEEGDVRQGGGQRGMREEGGEGPQQGTYGDERTGDRGQRGFEPGQPGQQGGQRQARDVERDH